MRADRVEDEPQKQPTARQRPDIITPFVAARTPLEFAIAEAWKEALGIYPLGVHDDFTELGGDSVTAARVIGLLKQTVGVELSIQLFFAGPTIAKQAISLTQGLIDNTDDGAFNDLLDGIGQRNDDA